MALIRIIVNRQKAAFNRKHKGTLPEEPAISIHDGDEIDYAYGVRLTGEWNIVQDYANSPCSGAHLWMESDGRGQYEITHRKPQSEFDAEGSDTQDASDSTPTPTTDSNMMDLF